MYRYCLRRVWRDPPSRTVAFVLLNPSTADAVRDDPTIARCVGFAKAWGFDALAAVNLFALRATDPAALRRAADPVGPHNDRYILAAAGAADMVVAAWGAHGAYLGRAGRVAERLARTQLLWHLGLTRSGQPRHPLYMAARTVPAPWHRLEAR